MTASGAIPPAEPRVVDSARGTRCYSPAHPLPGATTMSLRILACLLLTTGLSACPAPAPDAAPPGTSAHSPVGPATVQTPSQPLDDATRIALSRTGFQVTNDIEFLGSRSEAGIDRQIAFAVRMPASRVPAFLETAGFATPLKPGKRVFQTPVEGVDTAAATQVSAAQDLFRTESGPSLSRDVMVIHEDEETVVVHVWAYTT